MKRARSRGDGWVDRVIAMPVTDVTCTALQGLSDAQKVAEPDAGGPFRIDVGVRGLPEPRFRG